MTDYFGNGYWSARYFASGYWGLNVEQEPGAISARVRGSSSVSAVLSLAGEQPQAAAPPRLIPLQALFRAWRVSVVVPLWLSARVAGRSDVRARISVAPPATVDPLVEHNNLMWLLAG